MKEVTLEDFKEFKLMYDFIMSKGQIIQDIRESLDEKQRALTLTEIYDVNNKDIGFIAEDKWGDSAYPYFDIADFLDDDYIETYAKVVQERRKKEEEKIKREEEARKKSELAELQRLIEKYPDALKNVNK